MRQKLAKFMYGRNGSDELSKLLSIVAVILLIISMYCGTAVRSTLFLVAVSAIIYTYFRVFSKNTAARRRENAKYLEQKRRVKSRFRLRRDMWKQRKEYKFFKCPSCGATLRVPKGKGRIRIVCKKCGTAFEKKT
ncbi:MAG: hypothetical protein GXY26_07535 [Clostridiales bacterium]|jgi:DNA-directed RNA polymerase subunit M/transcription elongation factor TFIIS|nr:hypothetical protein [Clostridiales bacterium]